MSNEKKILASRLRQKRILAASARRIEERGRNRDWLARLSDIEYKSVYNFEHPFNLSSAWLEENHPDLPVYEAQRECGEKTSWSADSH